jgi:hypothetical protein
VGGSTQFPIDPFQQFDNPLLGQLISRITSLEQEVERLHSVEGLGHVGFSIIMSTQMSNIAIGVDTTIEFDTELFDIGNNFSTAIYTFTAPVNGYYQLITHLRLTDIDSAATWMRALIITSKRVYYQYWPVNKLSGDDDYVTFNFTAIADMDASDTAYITFRQQGGAAQTNVAILGTYFMGWLIG